MRGKWLWILMLTFPLMWGLTGCSKKTGEGEGGKTPDGKTTAGKTNAGKTTPVNTHHGQTTQKTGSPPAKNGGKRTGPAGKNTIDTTYIAKEFIGAVVIHPARILNSPFVRNLEAVLEKNLGKEKVQEPYKEIEGEFGVDVRTIRQVIVLIDANTANMAPMLIPRGGPDPLPKEKFEPDSKIPSSKGPRFPEPKQDEKTPPKKAPAKKGQKESRLPLQPETGVPLRLLAGLNSTLLQPGFGPGGPGAGGPPVPSVIVRFTQPPDRQKILQQIQRNFGSPGGKEKEATKKDEKIPGSKESVDQAVPPPAPKTYAGKTYTVHGPMAVCFVDDTTLLIASEATLKNMLDAKDVQSPLTQRLLSLSAENDIILALDTEPLAPLLNMLSGGANDPAAKEAFGYARKIKTLTLTTSLSGTLLVSAVLQLTDSDAAAGLTKMINEKAVQVGKAQYEMWKQSPQAKEVPPEAISMLDQLVEGLHVRQEGTDVVIGITRPADFDNLPQILEPAIKKARKAAERLERQNNLKQTGLAFHNYHDDYGHLPTADSAGHPTRGSKKIHRGLSWRVHLLPFLEANNLYNEFHLDEPWDSEHNKKLIPLMPDVFKTPGVTEPGKTSLHVFVGPGTPLGGMKAPTFADFKDGLSNTLLVVEAGPDKADIWTKPGGLPFDPAKNPKELLGQLLNGYFLGLLADGSVRRVPASIDAETLKALIQHADGKPVQLPR